MPTHTEVRMGETLASDLKLARLLQRLNGARRTSALQHRGLDEEDQLSGGDPKTAGGTEPDRE